MHFAEVPTNEILALPIDRLGYLVLRDLRNEWNWRNWLLGVLEGRQIRDTTEEANALAEAIQWLFSRNLISTLPAQMQSGDSVRITRLGQRALSEGLGFISVVERLNVDLLPILEAKVRPQFLLGDFELAAFAAMKELEIAVRNAAPQLSALLGADLMKQAFKVGGPLADQETEHTSEIEARMFLYAGAIGLFKNPASHRRVDYSDPTEASEVILLADLLIRMLGNRDEEEPS